MRRLERFGGPPLLFLLFRLGLGIVLTRTLGIFGFREMTDQLATRIENIEADALIERVSLIFIFVILVGIFVGILGRSRFADLRRHGVADHLAGRRVRCAAIAQLPPAPRA